MWYSIIFIESINNNNSTNHNINAYIPFSSLFLSPSPSLSFSACNSSVFKNTQLWIFNIFIFSCSLHAPMFFHSIFHPPRIAWTFCYGVSHSHSHALRVLSFFIFVMQSLHISHTFIIWTKQYRMHPTSFGW